MSQNAALILFQFVALIFAFSIHECAHAWTASRLGDQTARMLGRVTLNPIKHLDPLGSVILPLLSAFYGFPLIGWAKPTPVTARNLHNYKRDDILITIAGPISNLLVATASLIVLLLIRFATKSGKEWVILAIATVRHIPGLPGTTGSVMFPIVLILYSSVIINLLLFVFNLLPIPPLDGSRILRHYLPYRAAQAYDRLGGFVNLILLYALMRTGVIGILYSPLLYMFNTVLLAG